MTGLGALSARVRLEQAHALTFTHGEVLADFEIHLIREVHARSRELGTVKNVTANEWHVIDAAHAAMKSAPRQDLSDMGLAA